MIKKPDKKKDSLPATGSKYLKVKSLNGFQVRVVSKETVIKLGAEIRVMWPKLVRPNLDCPIRTVTVLQFKNGRSSKCEQFHESVV